MMTTMAGMKWLHRRILIHFKFLIYSSSAFISSNTWCFISYTFEFLSFIVTLEQYILVLSDNVVNTALSIFRISPSIRELLDLNISFANRSCMTCWSVIISTEVISSSINSCFINNLCISGVLSSSSVPKNYISFPSIFLGIVL